MENVEIGKVYRHFKGNYYFVENIAFDSETKERMVVYKPLYPRQDCMIWVRPESMFLEEIPEKYNLNGVDIPYYKFSKSNLIKNIKLPPMAEGIFYINNELYILFENSSNTYFYAFPKLKNIIKLNI